MSHALVRRPRRASVRLAGFGLLVLAAAAAPASAVPLANLPDDAARIVQRLAPRLYLPADEPFELVAVIPVLHPRRPIVAYHLFFDEDALLAGRGKSTDHEVLWVEYEPATLAVLDVRTLWHGQVLRTEECVREARAALGRPRVDVQWGQHGVLPYGWRSHSSLRVRLLLRVHYLLVRHVSRLRWVNARGFRVPYAGRYADYVRFDHEMDTRDLLDGRPPVVAEHCVRDLVARLAEALGAARTFERKKEWPEP